MKRIVLIMMVFAAMAVNAQSIQLSFTAADNDGKYHEFQSVQITNLTRGWSETLTYPDTTFTLDAGNESGIESVEGLRAGLMQNYPNPFAGHTETVLSLDESSMVTVRLVRMNGAVEYEKSGYMTAGDYHLGIDVSGKGMVYLQVQTEKRNYVTKMVNMRNGGTSKVEIAQTSTSPKRTTRKEGELFDVGDRMMFTAMDIENNRVIYSDAVIRTQEVSEQITLTFTAETENRCIVPFNMSQRLFIPDGPHCQEGGLMVGLDVTGYDEDRTIQNASEIASVCINYEHSFMGEHSITLICPNGQQSVLKENGGYNGMAGYPYGGNNHNDYDGQQACDELDNMYGIGLEYCFSRNQGYKYVNGEPANSVVVAQNYFNDNAYIDTVTVTFGEISAPFYGTVSEPFGSTFATKHASDKENKKDYYRPSRDFAELVGCPINGTWYIEIVDRWAIDNGWFFGWSIDIETTCDEAPTGNQTDK